MIDSECQQIDIGNRPRVVKAVPEERGAVAQGQIVGPKLVVALAHKEVQLINQFPRPEFGHPGVRRVGHDSHDAIFSQRTAGPSALGLPLPPTVGAIMENMVRVQQSNQDIDVEQTANAQMPS